MSISSMFGFNNQLMAENELPEIFPMGILAPVFIRTDLVNIFTKILTDVLERTHGLPDEYQPLLWDNCLQSESSKGLVHLIAWAMAENRELFLVLKEIGNLKVLRKADATEEAMIRQDYISKGSSSVGIFIGFKDYIKTEILRIYSGMEYGIIASLHKSTNLAKAIQIKMSDLRGSVGLRDSAEVVAQAKSMARALANGKDILLDVKDVIATAMVDITSTKAAIEFVDAKRAFYLGMPLSYISGEQATGIGTTGESDAKAIDRGLRGYYFSIVKPCLEALFGVETSFKTEDFRLLQSALEALKTFELVGDDIISIDVKRDIVGRLLNLNTPAQPT